MQKIIRQSKSLLLLLLVVLMAIPSCVKPPQTPKQFGYTLLVSSSNKHPADRIDPNFINGWGIAFSAGGVAWVSSEGTGLSEVWDKQGTQLLAGVTIPSAGNATSGGHPSGQIFNGTSDFKLPNGNPARFVFAGLDGIISGWNGGPAAVTAVDDSKGGASYSGIAIGQNEGNNYIYTANFGEGKIDVYDKNWAEVNMPFQDPDLPAGYSPFNIQNVNGRLFVMYAKIANGDEVKGAGLGFVDIYNPDGTLARRFASRGSLNAPWGVAEAPVGFWDGNDGNIIVGNFGDGRLNVFNKWGIWVGKLSKGVNPVVIEGLWGISFPPSTATALDPGRLYFAAGPDDEKQGVFGYIRNKTTP